MDLKDRKLKNVQDKNKDSHLMKKKQIEHRFQVPKRLPITINKTTNDVSNGGDLSLRKRFFRLTSSLLIPLSSKILSKFYSKSCHFFLVVLINFKLFARYNTSTCTSDEEQKVHSATDGPKLSSMIVLKSLWSLCSSSMIQYLNKYIR